MIDREKVNKLIDENESGLPCCIVCAKPYDDGNMSLCNSCFSSLETCDCNICALIKSRINEIRRRLNA